jgi:hypothetical protein
MTIDEQVVRVPLASYRVDAVLNSGRAPGNRALPRSLPRLPKGLPGTG